MHFSIRIFLPSHDQLVCVGIPLIFGWLRDNIEFNTVALLVSNNDSEEEKVLDSCNFRCSCVGDYDDGDDGGGGGDYRHHRCHRRHHHPFCCYHYHLY